MTRHSCLRSAWPAFIAMAAWAQAPLPPLGSQRAQGEAICVRVKTPQEAPPTPITPIPFQADRFALVQDAAPLAAASPTYTLKDLSALSYADLVTTLSGTTWDKVTDLWTYSPDAVTFFGDQNRMTYLINALATRCSQYTTTDAKGVPTLVEVIRCGFYQAFYHTDTLAYLGQTAFKETTFPALRNAQANPAFGFGTAAQESVLSSLGLLISDGSVDPGIVNGFTKIIQQTADNMELYAGTYSKGNAAYNILNGIDYVLNSVYSKSGSNVANTPFYKNIDGYLDQVFRLAQFPTYDTKTGWLIDASMWYAGYDGRYYSTSGKSLQILTQAIQVYGTAPWVYPSAQAAEIIVQQYGGKDASGATLDWAQIQNAIRAQYTPVKRDFDGGLFHTQVGTAVDPTKVKTLIWAHKETRAQFFRALRADTPVDPSHHQDDSLTMVIYDSPDAYRMNRFAYGLSTSNGGIMIESLGTFFTYERTPQQSYYSLEELFRHEGVHYLQGRYEEPGFFGGAPLYSNERLTWMDEGSAEFFAGSTRTESVKPRYIKAHLIAGYNPSTWYSISRVVHSTYATGWTFYDYSSEFVDYLYHYQWDNYLAMLDRLRANDPTGFSALCTQDADNAAMNSGYQDWLKYVAANANSFPSPSTSPDYLATIPAKPLSQVSAEIQGTTGLTNLSVTTTTGLDWNTYTLRGTYAAGQSRGSALADWQAMDAQANTWLGALTAKSWSGYKTDTCYFVNYAKDASNNVTWQVVFHGVNTDTGSLPSLPAVSAFSPASGAMGTVVTLTGSGFTGTTSVTFGGKATTGFTIVNDQTITVQVPSGAVSGVISVTNSNGSGSSATRFLDLDLNNDGKISILDMSLLAVAYGTPRTAANAQADLDGNGAIDDLDIAALLAGLN